MGADPDGWQCWKLVPLVRSSPAPPLHLPHQAPVPIAYPPPSSSESFAATGWRIGWLIGPASLVTPVLSASTRIIFCTNGPLQEAAAVGLEQASERQFFEIQRREYAERRQVLMDVFDGLGLSYTIPDGSYFLLVDVSRFQIPKDYVFPEIVEGRGRDFK